MKVLWFTNIALPELSRVLGQPPEVVGGWMSSLLDELKRRDDVELAVATSVAGQRAGTKHSVERVTYYSLPAERSRPMTLTPSFAAACKSVLDDFHPDLIHVHGTEEAYGRFTALLTSGPPVVVSIQGLIHVCARHVPGGITLTDAAECGLPGVLSWLRFKLMQRQWVARGESEREILAGNRHFIGRTAWDAAHLLSNNRNARYYRCEELLRPPFYSRRWDVSTARRHSVFCTAAHSPLKGFHLVLEALSILRHEFPEITVRVAGAPWDSRRGFGYYGRYLRALIDKLALGPHLVALPALAAEQVAEELANAAAFVIPSLIENSPNSLAEAMLVGTPCVASLVGGVPSMIENERSALGFPSGDAPSLAHCLRRVFRDDSLATALSHAARTTATARHDAAAVVASQLETYRRVASAP
jgi:glycosyltransferase involved in cell wall biosynthesis